MKREKGWEALKLGDWTYDRIIGERSVCLLYGQWLYGRTWGEGRCTAA